MDFLPDLIKIIVPAALVLYAMYLIVKSFLDRELQKQVVAGREKNTEIVLPIRLQAFERMVLFLERITPQNLLRRLSNTAELSAREFRQVLLHEIREEYNHNLSQQVYMSDESWYSVRYAMEEVIAIVNKAADGLPEDAPAIDLNRRILQKVVEENADPAGPAIMKIKNEIRQTF